MKIILAKPSKAERMYKNNTYRTTDRLPKICQIFNLRKYINKISVM